MSSTTTDASVTAASGSSPIKTCTISVGGKSVTIEEFQRNLCFTKGNQAIELLRNMRAIESAIANARAPWKDRAAALANIFEVRTHFLATQSDWSDSISTTLAKYGPSSVIKIFGYYDQHADLIPDAVNEAGQLKPLSLSVEDSDTDNRPADICFAKIQVKTLLHQITLANLWCKYSLMVI